MNNLINKIIQGDCLEVMKDIPDKSIDMVLTSPPYDNLRTYKGYTFNFEGIAKELYRVLKDGGVCVWVVGDATINGSETGTSFKQALYFKEIGFNLHDTMIYEKDNPPPVGGINRYYQSFEYMFVFSKGAPIRKNLIFRERRNKHNDKRISRIKAFNRQKDGSFIKKNIEFHSQVKRSNVWKYVVGGGNTSDYFINHPAMFPEKLAEDHIISWSKEGDIILDPMAGSGTTLKMAKKNNRNYIGIEIAPEYIDIIYKRL